MGADDLLQWMTQALYVAVFVAVARDVLRRPLRASIDTALLFGTLSLIIAVGWITSALHTEPGRWLGAANSSLLMALPYLLLRLVDDFTEVPSALLHAAEAGLALAVAGLFLIEPPLPGLVTLAYVLYFFGLELYAALAFIRQARLAGGITRRRMEAAAAGSAFLGLAILLVGLQAALPGPDLPWTLLFQLCALLSGIGYFLGFAPPGILRRAWQEPELRAFLARAASLPRLPTTDAIVRELERGAAAATGAPAAAIALWDPDHEALCVQEEAGPVYVPAGEGIVGRVFEWQRAFFSPDAARDDPANAEVYRRYNATAILSAPITAGEKRLGVLAVYAPRAPIFAADDLVLVQLLADQAAVMLESRALIDEAARVQAREHATRLKDDFLSAAAHDLKTPLTTLVAQAQLLERRAARNPEAPLDLAGVRRVVSESKRLNTLILELLDVSRLERGVLGGEREPVDLVQLAREVCEREPSERHHCTVAGDTAVVGEYNPTRMTQLLQNLVENAVKYSPAGGTVAVRVWREGGDAHLSVKDSGIGIPAADLDNVFDRFHRAANVDDRRFSGMGLGLYICRGIVEEYGGRIWATSRPGTGSTFHVSLPLAAGVTHDQR